MRVPPTLFLQACVCTLNAILVKGNMHNARLFLVLRARLTVGRFAPYASTPTVGGSLVTIRCRSCASLSSSTVFGAMDFAVPPVPLTYFINEFKRKLG